MKVVGEAADGAEAIALFQELRPAVTLVDLQMPKVDGIQAINEIHSQYPDAALVVLTTYPGDARVMRAMAVGAMSYLLKTASSEEIVRIVRAAAGGRKIVTGDVLQDVQAHLGDEILSPRELAALRLVAQGLTNRAIGDALGVSEDTIKTRMKNILAKLGAKDRAEAVTIAVRRGFLDLP